MQGAGENYENTLSAFKYAAELGTDMLELDCHLTKDGKVVVSHDSIVDKRTDKTGSILDYTYDELPLLKKTLPVDFMPGIAFTGSGKDEDRKFSLLKEVFELFPNLAINIDIKIDNDELIFKVDDLVKRYNREHLTVWGNMKDTITQKCYKQNPSICLLFSVRRVLIVVLQLYTGLLPFMPLKETHLEIFMPAHLIKIHNQNNGESKWWHNVIAQIANTLLIRRSLFDHLAKRGIQTYLWVMNTDEDFQMAYDTGATGIMTDYPSKLTQFLEKKPHIISNSIYEQANNILIDSCSHDDREKSS